MIGPVETAFRQVLAPILSPWPVRWSNDLWPAGVSLSPGGLPVDADGAPAPCAECEMIAGGNTGDVGPGGVTHQERSGLLRVYLLVATGTGTGAVNAMADAIIAAIQRRQIWADPAAGQCLRCWDVRPDDDVAATEEDSRFVRQLSAYWTFDYI